MTRQRQRARSRWVEVPIERVRIESAHHRADWPRRAELVPSFDERVARARDTGHWPGKPIRLRQHGDDYALVTGFSRLAIALAAGLPTVRAVIEPNWQSIPLAEIHLRTWQEKAHLNSEKLAQRLEQARQAGSLPIPLRVRPAWSGEPAGYILLDGLYWYYVARELAMEQVPVIVQS